MTLACRVCGSDLPEGALFCGTCGSSVTATRVRPPVADPRPADTSIVEPLPRPAIVGRFPGQDESVDAGQAPVAPVPPAAASAGGVEPAVPSEPAAPARSAVPARSAAPAPPAATAEPAGAVEPAGPAKPRFTFVFSTGETATITGRGLLGRRPIGQPGEIVDQFVSINDPERSVSKTHLEFGFEGDDLWLSDRYSGNGTVAILPEGVVRHFEPGRRYRVTRGTRVEIGDQFFVVS